MKLILSKAIRSVRVTCVDTGDVDDWHRSGLTLFGSKNIYIESTDYDEVAQQLLQQGFVHVGSE